MRRALKIATTSWALAITVVGIIWVMSSSASGRVETLTRECERARTEAPALPKTEVRIRRKSDGAVFRGPTGVPYDPEQYEAVLPPNPRAASPRIVEIPGLGYAQYPASIAEVEIEAAIAALFPCNLAEIRRLTVRPERQRRILEAGTEADVWSGRLLIASLVGAGLAAVGSLPWAWYFLLDRIREVAEAIKGRPSRPVG